ncbi:MAG: ATP-binding protein [Spirochaetales bacterium]|nr:ATP-binding protein [Candidatus Physcosoma equi]
MITGVRGAGKTVLMTSIENEFRENEEWIVVDLNSDRNLLVSLASELTGKPDLFKIMKEARINDSFLGFGVEIENQPPHLDVATVLDAILAELTRKGKKVLICIDEVVKNRQVIEFSSQFQIFMRKKYNVFLLMTGLYQNIYQLQNEKSLTFLYRAPKIEMEPLSLRRIARSYQDTFGLDSMEAAEMAKTTNGYPYAYQVLGYLTFRRGTSFRTVLSEFDDYLAEYVYEKIWSETSDLDHSILRVMAHDHKSEVDAIRSELGMDSNLFNVYRRRLLKKGILVSPKYGRLEFALPRFDLFIESL